MRNHLLWAILGLGLVLTGFFASGEYPQITKRSLTTSVSASALNASASTACMKLGDGRFLVLDHVLSRNTATAVETKCAAYRSGGCSDTAVKILSCTGASCDQYKPSMPISTSDAWMLRFDVAGVDYAICTFTATTGSGSDLLTARAYLTRE